MVGVLGNHTSIFLALSDYMIVNILWVSRSNTEDSAAHDDYDDS